MGYNISVYLDEASAWVRFKDACEKSGKRPNSVLRTFIEKYSEEVLGEISLEERLAKAMVEAKQISQGKAKGKNARELLAEL